MFAPKREKTEKIKLTKKQINQSKKLLSYLKPYTARFVIGGILLIITTSIGLIFPLMLGQLLGSGKNSSNMQDAIHLINTDNISTAALALFVLFGVQAVFSFFKIIVFNDFTELVMRDIRKDAFHRLINKPISFFHKHTVGELTSRTSSDVAQLNETLRVTLGEFFRTLVIVIGGIGFLAYISWKLSLLMLATVPVMAIVAVVFGKFIKRLAKEAQEEIAKSNTLTEEALMGITNVKAFTNELFLTHKYQSLIERIRALNIKSGLWRGAFVSFIVLSIFGSIVFVIWQGLLMTQGVNPEITSGDFYSFILLTIMIAGSFGSLPEMYSNVQKTIGATSQLMEIIDEPIEKELYLGSEKPEIQGNIQFENVSFHYENRPDIHVLKQLTFDITHNQTVALVGSSGAGKSTIASLIQHFYSINQGGIYFEKTNINAIDTTYLRSHIAYVPQEVLLFAGSIKENILFGNPQASEAEIIQAAQSANAWDFIQSFPEKLETKVGDRGIQLSGGQKQRIAIARAILKNPKILILDEATSALDSESEKLVQEAFNNLMKGRTSIVIAHRLSTIKNADEIIVLDKGEIKERGTHSTLMQLDNGIYKNLVQLQEFN
jgi:ABC-type multidrug transport system fused ATPase/permease subunit